MTIYAEVKGSTLVQYPYGFAQLQAENTETNYGSNIDFVSIFPLTQTAIANGYTLAPVTILPQPTYNPLSQICAQNAAPTLVNGVWTLGWTVTNLSADQANENVAAVNAPAVAASQQARLLANAKKAHATGNLSAAVNYLLQLQGNQS